MTTFFFSSDLHGDAHRYDALFAAIRDERPDAVLLGGDLLPAVGAQAWIGNVLARGFEECGCGNVVLIPGNDDPRLYETAFRSYEAAGLWRWLPCGKVMLRVPPANGGARGGRTTPGGNELHGGATVYGYGYVPPTPFLLKDWERYDVGHAVDPGCISPEDGTRSVPAGESPRYATIASDLERLAGADDLREAVMLFHTPPYRTALDRAALDGKSFDHAPLDVHVGSIAVRRFLESRQPRVTLHGHVHESARLTGKWMDRIGDTVLLGGAHDGPELALVRFDPCEPEEATRDLL